MKPIAYHFGYIEGMLESAFKSEGAMPKKLQEAINFVANAVMKVCEIGPDKLSIDIPKPPKKPAVAEPMSVFPTAKEEEETDTPAAPDKAQSDKPPISKQRPERVRELAESGLGDGAIAARLGISMSAVWQMRNRHDIPSGRHCAARKAQTPPEVKKTVPVMPDRIPSSPEALIDKHNSYAGRRDAQPRPLVESDWLDIRYRRLTLSHSISTIASDYMVSPSELETFISEQLRQEEATQKANGAKGK